MPQILGPGHNGGLKVSGAVSSEIWPRETTRRLWMIKRQEDSRWSKSVNAKKNEHGEVVGVPGTRTEGPGQEC